MESLNRWSLRRICRGNETLRTTLAHEPIRGGEFAVQEQNPLSRRYFLRAEKAANLLADMAAVHVGARRTPSSPDSKYADSKPPPGRSQRAVRWSHEKSLAPLRKCSMLDDR